MLSLAFITAILTPAVVLACVELGNVPVGPTLVTTIVNCVPSNVSSGQLATLLASTDAFKLGLLAGKDRFIANGEWLIWIDTHAAPGILRGLWPTGGEDANYSFVGNPDDGLGGTGGTKSLLSLMSCHDPTAPTTIGYMGFHVEIWGPVSAAAGGHFYTYQHVGTDYARYETTPDHSLASFQFPLVDCVTRSDTFIGYSGGRGAIFMVATYTVTHDVLNIVTQVNCTSPVDTLGDMGGLLLQPAPACGPSVASCPDDIHQRALSVLEVVNAGSGYNHTSCSPDTGEIRVLYSDGPHAAWDMYGLPYSSPDSTQERVCVAFDRIAQAIPDEGMAPWTLKSLNGSAAEAFLRVLPQYRGGDPYDLGHEEAFAYHFNDHPADMGGITGRSSLDLFMRGADGQSIAFGGNRGMKTFEADIFRHPPPSQMRS